MATLWDRLFKNTAQAVRDRGLEGMKTRGSVARDKQTGDLVLNYYPRSDIRDLDSIPLATLQAGKTPKETSKKLAVVVLLLLVLGTPVGYVTVRESSNGPADIFMMLALLLYVATVAMIILLHFGLVQLDKDWQKAIQQMYDQDTLSKMFGIKSTLIAFRRFIRWRRVLGYLLDVAWVYLLAEPFVLSGVATLNGWLVLPTMKPGFWNLTDYMFFVVSWLFQAGCIAWLSYLRWLFTGRRDPALQLCVMLVEENRNVVAASQSKGGR